METHHPDTRGAIDRTGLFLIAGAATISLVATTGLLLYVLALQICIGRPSTSRWASMRLAFMRTTFGPLFLNLAVADFVQSLGLMHNYFGSDMQGPKAEVLCTSQGFMVQLGDVASALISLLIAIETFVILSNTTPTRWGTLWAAAIVWLLCISFSSAGLFGAPEFDFSSAATWTGGWCWIAFETQGYRVVFHQMWLWFTAIVSTVLYGVLYWRIRGHYKGEAHVLRRSSIVLPPQDYVSVESFKTTCAKTSSLRRVAWTMLVYPITFFVLTIPVSILSVMTVENSKLAPWRNILLTIFGSLFAIRGAINVVVFGMTRNVFFLREAPAIMDFDEKFAPPSPSGSKHSLRLTFQSDLCVFTEKGKNGGHLSKAYQVSYPTITRDDPSPVSGETNPDDHNFKTRSH